MGNTIQQWRASIGSWTRGYMLLANNNSTESYSSPWYKLLVILVLLIIGGVEMNPGPTQSVMSTFEKTNGFADMTGELYEIKLSALLFLRALQTGQEFQLASNMKAAGSFDDVVLTLGDCTMFLQLKHKEKTQTVLKLSKLTRHKDFNLPKYLKSYLEIKQSWQNNPDLQRCGKFEDAKFIIYTNARVHETLVNTAGSAQLLLNNICTTGACVCLTELFDSLPKYKAVLSAAVGSDDITATPEIWEVVHKLYNKEAQVLPSKKQLQDILEHLEYLGDLTLYQQFIPQLYLCTGQTAEKDLSDHIRREILTTCGTDIVLREFMDGIQNWWRSSKCYLTVNSQFFQDIIKKIAANVIKDSLSVKVKFLENECNNIRQTFSYGNKNVYLKTGCTDLSCVKVLQSFETNLLVDVNTLKTRLKEVLAVWRLGMCDVLVVEGEIIDTDILHTFAIMPDPKSVVVISDTGPTQLYQQFNFASFTDTFCFSQLDSDSQREVLDRQLMFQGFPVKMSSLADVSFLENSITADVLVQLHHTLKIGHKLDDLDPCYIPRTFLRREYVSEQIFTEEHITFAVTGIAKYRLAQLVPSDEKIKKFNVDIIKDETCRYLLITGEAEFTALCGVNENIHWIQTCEEGFFWIKSKGDVSPVIKHLKQEYVSYAGAEKILAVPHQIALIEAQPGMGKSTEMCNIAHMLKHKDPSTWVIKVDLNQFTTLLSQNQVGAMEFLETVATLNTKFQKLLFEHQLQTDANVAILLDAFDEISPNYSDQVFCLLKDFSKINVKKIFVNSRPVIIKELQQKLSTLAFSFQPFTANDQQNFLIKYWNQSSINSPALYSFISSLLQLVGTSLNDKLKELTGIPLQCKMLGEIFQDEALHYCQTGNVRLPQSLNVLQLYDKFVEKKWEIYCNKLYEGMKNIMLHELIQNQKRQLQKCFMSCALVSYLDDYHISRLHSSKNIKKQNDDFVSQFKDGKEKTGIVTNIINDKAVFVHRTFAEYFVAMWFSEHIDLELNNVKVIYFDQSFQTVRKFLDRILAQEFKLHIAVLEEDFAEVKKLLLTENFHVNQRDKGGRTPLHLTLLNYCFNRNDKINDSIIEVLLEHGADVNCKDRVLRWRPLRLAEEIRAWSLVDKLLEKQADSRNLVWIRRSIKMELCVRNPVQVAMSRGIVESSISVLKLGIGVKHCMSELLQMVMYTALSKGYMNLVKFIFKCGVSVRHNIARSYIKTTMLHISAEHGQLRLVQFLIEKGAHVNENNDYNRVPLIQAAACGHLQVVQLLVEHGASVHARDIEGASALSFAARNGKDEIVKLLIQKGAEVNEPSGMFNRTPLMQAAMCYHVRVVELLLVHGAHVNARDNYGDTALSLLVDCEERKEVIQLLLQYGAHK